MNIDIKIILKNIQSNPIISTPKGEDIITNWRFLQRHKIGFYV